MLFIAAVVVGMLAPVLQMFDVLAPLTLPAAVNIAGAVIAAIGTVATVAAQEAMGASWRVGVDSHGAAGEDATTVSTSQRPRRAVRRTVRREVTTTCSSSTNTICERRCSATRTTTTTIDHTKPYNSHHHDRTGRSQSRAARRYVADRSYGLINEYEATAA
ncbi:hypothetical protein [Saccharothrix sp. NRRL B-16348]|uniref:hypothetical protein n=1 Tax=Saccharothrix sp. NRRL B-16348 TaxID=1415542 RepID=UPI0006AEB2B4|nr:hypothetical protein [Saccharothrix sp. NRRL B-16348]